MIETASPGANSSARLRRRQCRLCVIFCVGDAGATLVSGSEAWAVSFYLSESQPKLYTAYLEKTAQRAAFSNYPAGERMADFQAIFGRDLKMIEAKFLRYMQDVK